MVDERRLLAAMCDRVVALEEWFTHCFLFVHKTLEQDSASKTTPTISVSFVDSRPPPAPL